MFDDMSHLTDGMQRHRPAAERRRPTPRYERVDGRGRIVLSTWVDESVAAVVDELAAARDESRSAIVRQAVTEYVKVRGGWDRVPAKAAS